MKVVSLFSGAGGLDLGFINAGFDIIWANDNYHDAVETYKINIGQHIVEKEIQDIKTDDIPDGEIVIGGFPCQGFSVANQNRNEHDERNKLYIEYLRVISDKKPKYFLAENVKGILSLAKGKVFDMIITDFKRAGYNVQYKLLNAADYGVPQRRERVFIFGIRNDLEKEFDFPNQEYSQDATVEGTKIDINRKSS